MSRKKRGRFPGDQWFQRKVENLMRKTLREQQAHGKMRGTTVEDLRGTAWYKEEFQKHAKLFKEIRKTQAEERAAHARSASLKEQAETAEMIERDKVWAAEHEGITDEELLDYLHSCAEELGHTPVRREVLGSTYISERFGNWAVALTIAELPLPRGMKPPKQTALNAYLKQRNRAATAMAKAVQNGIHVVDTTGIHSGSFQERKGQGDSDTPGQEAVRGHALTAVSPGACLCGASRPQRTPAREIFYSCILWINKQGK